MRENETYQGQTILYLVMEALKMSGYFETNNKKISSLAVFSWSRRRSSRRVAWRGWRSTCPRTARSSWATSPPCTPPSTWSGPRPRSSWRRSPTPPRTRETSSLWLVRWEWGKYFYREWVKYFYRELGKYCNILSYFIWTGEKYFLTMSAWFLVDISRN